MLWLMDYWCCCCCCSGSYSIGVCQPRLCFDQVLVVRSVAVLVIPYTVSVDVCFRSSYLLVLLMLLLFVARVFVVVDLDLVAAVAVVVLVVVFWSCY